MRLLTRDSALWILAIIGSVVVYMGTLPPPPEWSYEQWVNFVAFLVATISGKLATSPLPHSEEGNAKITPDGR